MNPYQQIRRRMRRGLLEILGPCSEMTKLISECLDRRLRVSEAVKLRLHLGVCAWCARYLLQLKVMRKLLQLHEESFTNVTTAGLSADARKRIALELPSHSSSQHNPK